LVRLVQSRRRSLHRLNCFREFGVSLGLKPLQEVKAEDCAKQLISLHRRRLKHRTHHVLLKQT